ncbi:polyprenyl-phosphate transporter [Azotobacter salinestris]|uniref:DUF368 domain-containing protein n=1 Tax=Azotobacter salinestris TaxID=69964 RepID=UPI001266AD6D|nr:DUF368 domain-containing protein [Azotobacter salinestris]
MKASLLLFLKGAAMGAADVVPGVSGGTVAFITGIYDELLHSIGRLPDALPLLLRGRVAEAWQRANATFLLILLSGILGSVFSLARLITWLLEHQPIPLWSFFFGLILVSSWLVGREISRWSWPSWLSLVVGASLAWWITVSAPMQWGHDPLSLFFAGAIAICAMILPGISGSFLLVLMGLYGFVLDAVKGFDLSVLLVFAAGCACGLLSFARLLSWMLDNIRNLTLTFLTGLMIGSLNKVWPWKQTLAWQTGSHGKPVAILQENLLPTDFAAVSGQDPQLLLAIVLALSGIGLVLFLESLAGRRQPAGNAAE